MTLNNHFYSLFLPTIAYGNPYRLLSRSSWSHQRERDITVLPSRDCLSSRNIKPGCCRICSPSHVASSTGSPLHLTRHSLIIQLLNPHSLCSKTSSGTNSNCPSSSSGGNSSEVVTCSPTTFLRQETWNTLWILLPSDSYSL
jgi:hypothetical protein